jgi:hypothetical protein
MQRTGLIVSEALCAMTLILGLSRSAHAQIGAGEIDFTFDTPQMDIRTPGGECLAQTPDDSSIGPTSLVSGDGTLAFYYFSCNGVFVRYTVDLWTDSGRIEGNIDYPANVGFRSRIDLVLPGEDFYIDVGQLTGGVETLASNWLDAGPPDLVLASQPGAIIRNVHQRISFALRPAS